LAELDDREGLCAGVVGHGEVHGDGEQASRRDAAEPSSAVHIAMMTRNVDFRNSHTP
jgi:hypothetical protein